MDSLAKLPDPPGDSTENSRSGDGAREAAVPRLELAALALQFLESRQHNLVDAFAMARRQHQRHAALFRRRRPLYGLVVEILVPEPEMSWKEVLRRLYSHQFGDVIYQIDDVAGVIEWWKFDRRKGTAITPFTALPSLICRARKEVRTDLNRRGPA